MHSREFLEFRRCLNRPRASFARLLLNDRLAQATTSRPHSTSRGIDCSASSRQVTRHNALVGIPHVPSTRGYDARIYRTFGASRTGISRRPRPPCSPPRAQQAMNDRTLSTQTVCPRRARRQILQCWPRARPVAAVCIPADRRARGGGRRYALQPHHASGDADRGRRDVPNARRGDPSGARRRRQRGARNGRGARLAPRRHVVKFRAQGNHPAASRRLRRIPMSVRRRVRMRHAADLLTANALSIDQVALRHVECKGSSA